MAKKTKYDIVIIDSGVNCLHPVLNNNSIEGLSIHVAEDTACVSDDFADEFGHGTAVYSIIHKNVPGAHILNIRLTTDKEDVAESPLVSVLEYIYEKVECKIVNISMGVRVCENNTKLYSVCLKLSQMGIVIVAAFDNDGYMSYPACYDCVIGVDAASSLTKNILFEYIEGASVNICWKKTLQRVPWIESKYAILDGTSFACAHVTSKLYEYSAAEAISSVADALEELKKHAGAVRSIGSAPRNDIPDEYFRIINAAIFPFNKEMHALIRFQEDLDFCISHVYDVRQSGRVGANCYKLIGGIDYDNNVIIENIEHIDWSVIDTIIIGHCDELNASLSRDIRFELISAAVKNNVNVYSFDPLTLYMHKIDLKSRPVIYWPSIEQHHIPRKQLTKLYSISKPVLGIFGTSSSQGKLTLQLTLRRMFTNNGYSVGCIGTEPTGKLLGMEYAYPMGYNNSIFVADHDSIQILNGMVHSLCEADNEIIITAGQSNSIPFAHGRLENYPVRQNVFILGVQPDVIILCINYFDAYDYISNTIKYLEGISEARVLGLVLFPLTVYDDWRSSSGSRTPLDSETADLKCADVQNNIGKPCFFLNNSSSMNDLYTSIVDYLK